jgi:hypothetical protein
LFWMEGPTPARISTRSGSSANTPRLP